MYRTANPFVKTLLQKKVTLALAESMTCGLAAHQLSTCKGTAEVFKGSIVCYNEEVKKELLKVPPKLIQKHSCESSQITESLAKQLAKLIKADIHAAITGLASAGGSETNAKPVGTVFFCVRYKNKIYNERKVFRGTPLEIRTKACYALYDLILEKLNK